MKSLRLVNALTFCLLLFRVTTAQPVCAEELITNGGFETGSLTGWFTANQTGGSGSFFVATGTLTPVSGNLTVGPANGNYYAVSDQSGPGSHVLYQPLTVPVGTLSATLSFDMFVNNYDQGGVPFFNAAGLDYTVRPNQQARVDLLGGNASPFDTSAGVIRNFYRGAGTSADPGQYSHYSFDITSDLVPGESYLLRFAEVDNQSYLNQGVDNVSITATLAPEPASLTLLALGGLALLDLLRRRRLMLALRLLPQHLVK